MLVAKRLYTTHILLSAVRTLTAEVSPVMGAMRASCAGFTEAMIYWVLGTDHYKYILTIAIIVRPTVRIHFSARFPDVFASSHGCSDVKAR